MVVVAVIHAARARAGMSLPLMIPAESGRCLSFPLMNRLLLFVLHAVQYSESVSREFMITPSTQEEQVKKS